MSQGQDDSAEKSFEATPQKLEEARKKGELVKSTDLHTAAAYGGFLLFLWQFAGAQSQGLGEIGAHLVVDADAMSERFLSNPSTLVVADFLGSVGLSVALVFLLPAIGVLGSLLGQRAVVIAPSRITPRLDRLSPLSNAKQKFGISGLLEFAKTFVKMMIYGSTLTLFLFWNIDTIVSLAQLSAPQVILQMAKLLFEFMALVLVISIFIGAIDYLWQRFDHLRKNRMSRKELMDETKNSEGDPHFKGKRKQRAQEIALNQMLADVPDASVVIVNPTHYAVALKWAPGDPTPPICVAKGVDDVAARIRQIAMENGVPIRSDPPTARAIYGAVDVGTPVDRAEFAAVAAAIRYATEIRDRARKQPWAK